MSLFSESRVASHQQVFVRLVQREVLQRIESSLWYGIEVEYELVQRKRFAVGVLERRQPRIVEAFGDFVK